MAPTGAPTCPAAAKIVGASAASSGVICRVMQHEHEQVDPSGMSAGTYAFTKQAEGGVFLTMKSDPTSVVRFCHGHELPVLDDADGYSRDSYTYCPVWQAARDAQLEGRAMIQDEEPEQVSMGVEDTLSSDDPWAAARRDLDLLAS